MNGERAALFATDPPYLVDYDGSNHPTRNKDWSSSYGVTWDDSSQGAELYDGFIAAAVAEAKLGIDDLDAPLIGAFLDHLERDRKNSVRARNARLAAIRSLFRYAALRHPDHAATIERGLAIPPKRFERRLVTWLTEAEVDALLAAPDRATWTGRRDAALFGLAVQTASSPSCGPGSPSAPVCLGTRCSQYGPAASSAATRLSTGWLDMSRTRPPDARPSRESG